MALLTGQLTKDEEREPIITPAIPEGSVGIILVRLFPNGYQQKKLTKLADLKARL